MHDAEGEGIGRPACCLCGQMRSSRERRTHITKQVADSLHRGRLE